ncbi:uncharacterized protein LOC125492760 [Beta vulgaris subsp. vulgaris]|uniref:uncharacterized protein LOC125492760 n=1 Tax=Beta vulgaris subsp. vulgaris TaxID=3555 RepID=UPI002036C5F7|nr:uncharacterized protein LOC125492760 [Beta vulgaris subsp. vulgaris]
MRFEKKGKLSPKFIGPYEILDRIGEVAYRLALPPGVDRAHNVFHVSQLRRYISDPSHVLQPESLQLDDNMTYEEFPVQILDHKVRKTRKGETKIVTVLWSNHNSEESTWEAGDVTRLMYPHLFTQTFYNRLSHEVQISIDAIAECAFMGKTTAEAKALLEEMATNSYHWSN